MGTKRIPIRLMLFLFLICCTAKCEAAVWTVDDSGGSDFPTIAAAVTAAGPGDSIHVRPGTYNESVVVDKILQLIADDSNAVIAGVAGDTLTVTVGKVSIKGFTIQGAPSDYAGIYLSGAPDCHISSNIITGNDHGIKLNDSNSIDIINNVIESNSDRGIWVYNNSDNVFINKNTLDSNFRNILIDNSSEARVDNNVITNSNVSSVFITGASNNNIITENDISYSGSAAGIHISTGSTATTVKANSITLNYRGIYLKDTSGNHILDNLISQNEYDGLELTDSPDNIIEKNEISLNNSGSVMRFGCYLIDSDNVSIKENEIYGQRYGIMMDNSDNCYITANNITSNTVAGISLGVNSADGTSSNSVVTENTITDNERGIQLSGSSNTIYENIFVNTYLNIEVLDHAGDNTWNVGSIGNFWNDYYGDDDNDDGIGDTPYVISEGNVDNKPRILVSHFATVNPFFPQMNKPYTINLELFNRTELTDIVFTGLKQTRSFPPAAPWGGAYAMAEPNLLDAPCTLDPCTPYQFQLDFTNEWEWLKPLDWKFAVLDFVLDLNYFSYSVGSFLYSCTVADKIVPSVKYIIQAAAGSHDFIVFSYGIPVYASFEKVNYYCMSVELQVASMMMTVSSWMGGPFAPAYWAAGAACSAASISAYNAAFDPVPDYTQVVPVEYIDPPEEIATLPEGTEKNLAMTSLELLAFQRAANKSYIQYEGARADGNTSCMALQLDAAAKFNDMAAGKLRQVQSLTAILTANMSPLTESDWQNFRNSIEENGLPQLQQDLLEQMGYESYISDIKNTLLGTTARPEKRQFYGDPNNLYKYQNLTLRSHHLLEDTFESTIQNEGLTIPTQHDLAVKNIWLWPTVTEINGPDDVQINVEIENCGTEAESLLCDVYYNDQLIISAPNSLTAGQSKTLTFNWNTTGLPGGYYQIKANIITGPTDDFPGNNTHIGPSVMICQAADTSPPTDPNNLRYTALTPATVSLEWDASTDNVGLSGYEIYRDANHVGSTTATNFTDTSLTAETSYTYTVIACDLVQNQSGPNTLQITTPSWDPVKVVAGDSPTTNEEFGKSVAVWGDVAVVGALYDNAAAGSAYVFKFDGSNWVEQTKLTASDAWLFDRFGTSVDIYEDTIVIGAKADDDNGTDSGSAYVFRFEDPNWVQEAKLTAFDGTGGEHFGTSVAVWGDSIIVGAPDDNDYGTNSGSAYAFWHNAGSWLEEGKMVASDSSAGDSFGQSVDIRDITTTIIGSPGSDGNDTDSGSAYIFRYVVPGWAEQAKLSASDGQTDDEFGRAVSIDANYIIAGATGNAGDGAAYVFNYDDPNWIEQAKLTTSNPTSSGSDFGRAVSISDNYAAIGAPYDYANGTDAGSVYVFKRQGTTWPNRTRLLIDESDTEDDYFGSSVAVGNSFIIGGAPGDDENDNEAGAAYIFYKDISAELENPDINSDDCVDYYDLNFIATYWLESDTYIPGNINYDDSVNLLDFSILATDWQGYCSDPM